MMRRSFIGPRMVAATVAIGALGAFTATSVRDARLELLGARDELLLVRESVLAQDDAATNERLARVEDHLRAARSAVHRFPLGLLAPIPLFGSPVKAIDDATDAGREGVKASRLLVDALAAFPTTSGQVGVEGRDLTPLYQASVDSQAALVKARGLLATAESDLDGPAGAFLPLLSGPAKEVRELVADARAQLDGSRRGLDLLGRLTNSDAEARVLVVAQDSLELRPTGGFIGSFGVLTFSKGTVNLERYDSFEGLPPPEPPMEPPPVLADFLPRWWGLSNVNWWPDFPTSAAKAKEMFKRQGGGDVDAVLAITEHVMAKLVGVFGSVQVPGYDEPIVEEGFDQRVLYEVELKRPLDDPRKKFLIELSKEVFHRLFQLDPEQLPGVADVLDASVGAGDVQLWFADPARQQLLGDSAWSGALPKPDGDFLMVVDANLSASKANAELERDITYQVHRDKDGVLWSELAIVLRNEGTKTQSNPLYNGYLRIYVPKGAKLLTTGGGAQLDEGVAPDGPYQVFSSPIVVDPGGTEELLFHYELPATVSAENYQLTWLRQAGTPRDMLSARVDGKEVIGTAQDRTLTIESDLTGNGFIEMLRRRWIIRKLGL
ncbi:MAG: DUF4012 domain-containing protein [Acidimicrobiales bacterium]